MSELETPTNTSIDTPPQRRWRNIVWAGLIVVALILVAGYTAYHQASKPPAEFPSNQTFTIAEGSSVATITHQLKADNIIRSANLLYFIFLTKYDATSLKAGTYNITSPLNVYEVADLLVQGDFTADLLRVTHLEGDSVVKLADRLRVVLPDFDDASFIAQATAYEGKLFPDTYLVPPRISTKQLITVMHNRYQAAFHEYQSQINTHHLTEDEIIILASIIEREANSTTSMKLVSGILQNRLEIDMPLQVDASMEYVLDKPLSELVPSDLEQDSPYNTYRNVGLPPTAIGNPGLNSILAVLEPTTSDYLYYITAPDGQFHYARTFDEHRENIARYLR